ncbi:MAG: PBP1A family penicillin-binding protein [Patescibacteria group bacterium]
MSLTQRIKSGRDFKTKRRSFFQRKPSSAKNLSFRHPDRGERIKTILKYLFSLGVVLALFGSIFVLAMFAWTTKELPDPNRLMERNLEQSTTIYDREGTNILYQIHGNVNRRLITLSELPEYIKWSTITTEDRKFYEHSGFSITGMIRSAIVNVLRSGKAQGGSTITQQFVKNAILTPQKTYTRKIKEVILAYRIEQKFSKDEILQLYFNEIPYGSVLYGIEAASQTFFGKSAKDLTLAQAAILAAIPQRPTYFSPYGNHVDELLVRQQYILDEMTKLGYITDDQAATAKAEKIEFKPQSESMQAPHFVTYVRELLADQFGERYVEEGGLKVTTTLNIDYQKAAEEAIAEYHDRNLNSYQAGNAALVAIDAPTGQVLAMVGSADFYNEEIDGQVNVALRPRQPGSSFKPIAYTEAFKKGFTPDTILYDVETVFKTDSGPDYIPHNYNLKEYGPITMRQALAGSLNIPAVKTLYLSGVDSVLDLAEKMGYSTFQDRSRFGLSLVLGGGEVKLLEHTAAYATLAQEGVYHPPAVILKVEDPQGQILFELKPTEKKVLDPETARQTVSVISDNTARAFIFGEKNYLTLPNRPVAAKTGTTNDFRDAWTMGFTPSLAAGVWVGNSNNDEMKRGADGSVVAAPIWNKFMQTVLQDKPVENFNPPPENTTEKPILRGQIAGAIPTRIDRASGKLATEYTPASFVVEKTFSQNHCILYYVDKNDPTGPPPTDPFADPQYPNWEDAIRSWVQRKGIAESTETPPTEFDDLHIPANFPSLEIIAPENGATITNNQLIVNITTTAPRGVSRVEYYLDDQLIKTVPTSPFNLNTTVDDVSSGFHNLRVKSLDDIDNSEGKSIEINLLLDESPVKISWQQPSGNTTINTDQFPYTLEVKLTAFTKVDRIDFIYTPINTSKSELINRFDNPGATIINTPWLNPPAPGNYKIYSLVFKKNGGIIRSEEIEVTIK